MPINIPGFGGGGFNIGSGGGYNLLPPTGDGGGFGGFGGTINAALGALPSILGAFGVGNGGAAPPSATLPNIAGASALSQIISNLGNFGGIGPGGQMGAQLDIPVVNIPGIGTITTSQLANMFGSGGNGCPAGGTPTISADVIGASIMTRPDACRPRLPTNIAVRDDCDKEHLYRKKGRPLLYADDLAACKRVDRIAARVNRARGRRRPR